MYKVKVSFAGGGAINLESPSKPTKAQLKEVAATYPEAEAINIHEEYTVAELAGEEEPAAV